MVAKLYPLGINGYMPSFGRQTMCVLLLTESDLLLLDAGSGLARLFEPSIARLLESYDCINIILSHYHLDHIIGLSYLPDLWTKHRVRIYAPGPPYLQVTPQDALSCFLGPPFLTPRLDGLVSSPDIVPISQDTFQVGRQTIRVRSQRHPGGSIGIRVGNLVAYITDTIVDPSSADFANGVRLLMHEVWLSDSEALADKEALTRHSYAGGVAQIAATAKAHRLAAIHLNPRHTDADIQKLSTALRDSARIEVEVLTEGQSYVLGC